MSRKQTLEEAMANMGLEAYIAPSLKKNVEETSKAATKGFHLNN